MKDKLEGWSFALERSGLKVREYVCVNEMGPSGREVTGIIEKEGGGF